MNEQKIPSVTIFGCGGAGCNLVSKLSKAFPKNDNITYKVIDSSRSNMRDLDNVTVYSVGELGAGKDRRKCLAEIQLYLDKHPEITRNTSDITFIISSFAGGTGSAAANLLFKYIMRHTDAKSVIIVGVADASSERDCLNSIMTLKTFNEMAKELSISLPMLMFSNTMKVDNVKPGRAVVDQTIVTRLTQLLNLLTSRDITEIDWQDKVTYLRPQDSGCECGLCSLSISDSDLDSTIHMPGEMKIILKESDIAHSMLVVNETGSTPDILTNVSYVGVSECEYTSVMCEGIPPALTQDLVDRAEWFKHSAKMKSTLETDLDKFGEKDKSGLIL